MTDRKLIWIGNALRKFNDDQYHAVCHFMLGRLEANNLARDDAVTTFYDAVKYARKEL
jgi:hypothetical protein